MNDFFDELLDWFMLSLMLDGRSAWVEVVFLGILFILICLVTSV